MAAPHDQGPGTVPPRPRGGPPPGGDDTRSLGDLLSTLTSQISTLFQKEVELARTEIKHDVRQAGRAGAAMGAAGGAAYMAVLLLSFALAWGLGEFLPVWAGFLIVGALYGVVAAVLYSRGKQRLDEFDPKPEQTIDTLKEDMEWARNRRT